MTDDVAAGTPALTDLAGISLGAAAVEDTGPTCEVTHISTTATLGTAPAAATTGPVLLADHTTLRVGGPAGRYVVAATEADLVGTVQDCDRRGEPVLILSGGSNMLVSDDGFDGTVVQVATHGVEADVSDCGGAAVRVEAGESWDDFVALAIERGWIGIEALSGIPGLVGATPIQNVSAYGCELAETIASVRTYDRRIGQAHTFPLVDCGFGYRTSRFKEEPGRFVVLQVNFQFTLGDLSLPIAYPELARTLGVEVGTRVNTTAVREAVRGIRAGKGMVLDPADHDTWSAGSFFTNPLLTPEEAASLPEEAPRFPAGDGRVKTSAAWLIDHAGFHRGYGTGPATLSTKHVLALTNRGGATASDLIRLAREVRDGVRERYGIALVPEPVLVGVSLDG